MPCSLYYMIRSLHLKFLKCGFDEAADYLLYNLPAVTSAPATTTVAATTTTVATTTVPTGTYYKYCTSIQAVRKIPCHPNHFPH